MTFCSATVGVFDLAGSTSVTDACSIFGVHRSTYYAGSGGRPERPGDAAAQRAAGAVDAQSAVGDGRAADRGLLPRASRPRPASGRRRVGPAQMGRDPRRAQQGMAGASGARPRHAQQTAQPDRRVCRAVRAAPSTAHTAAYRLHVRGSWSAWTASSSVACAAPSARSGS